MKAFGIRFDVLVYGNVRTATPAWGTWQGSYWGKGPYGPVRTMPVKVHRTWPVRIQDAIRTSVSFGCAPTASPVLALPVPQLQAPSGQEGFSHLPSRLTLHSPRLPYPQDPCPTFLGSYPLSTAEP